MLTPSENATHQVSTVGRQSPLSRSDAPPFRYAEAGLILLCLFLFFFRLGAAKLFDLDEGLYATCARNMVVTGNWITPTLNTRPMLRPKETSAPFYEKPILVYWCAAASVKMFGASEFALRLPSALASLLAVASIYYAGRRWFGRRAGLLAAAVYATAPMTIVDARQLTTDALLVLTITIAMMSFWESGASITGAPIPKSSSRLRFPILFWLMCALAVLVKGAIGLVIPALIITVNVTFERLRFRFRWAGRTPGEFAFGARWNRLAGIKPVLRRLGPLPGILVLIAVAVPWHLAVARTGRVDAEGRIFYQEYIVRQHIGRFKGLDQVHNAPLPTYFVYFLLGFFPWACFAPTAFRSPNYEGSPAPEPLPDSPEDSGAPFPWPSIAYVSKPEDEVHRFLLIWFWTIFIFFTIAAAKLPNYIVPAYPAAAILVGRWFDLALKDDTRFPAMCRAIRGVLATALLLLAGGILYPVFARRNPQTTPEVIAAVQHLVLALSAGCVIAWLAMRNGEVAKWRRVGVAALVGAMAVMVAVATTEGYAAVSKSVIEPKDLAVQDARSDASAGVTVVFYNISNRMPSMLYYAATYSPIERKETPLLPYLQRVLGPGERRVDVVLSTSSLQKELAPELSASAWRQVGATAHDGWWLVKLAR